MDFVFDRYTALPADAQIQEQIKLALLLGRLRPGDTLPSIREVEKQVGISRNLVRKAYLELQRWGILCLRHGKGVIVDATLKYGEKSDIGDQCEVVSRQLIANLHNMGVSSSSFARYFYRHAREDENKRPFLMFVDVSRMQAQERAAKISAAWRVSLPGLSIEEFAAMDPALLKGIRKILTTYLRYDQVLQIVDGKGPEVIPIGLTIDPSTAREFAALPRGASIVFVIDDRDQFSLSLLLEPFRKLSMDPSKTIESLPLSQIPDLKCFVQSKKYNKILFSNRIWDKLPESIRRHSKVSHPHMAVDLGSLESVRIRAGIIV
jgi:DNA-binding transcriptional regulator YhcF (GntR family)